MTSTDTTASVSTGFRTNIFQDHVLPGVGGQGAKGVVVDGTMEETIERVRATLHAGIPLTEDHPRDIMHSESGYTFAARYILGEGEYIQVTIYAASPALHLSVTADDFTATDDEDF